MFNGVVAQMARASALQAEGREFESHLLHKNKNNQSTYAGFGVS